MNQSLSLPFPYFGELMSVLCALLWAIAVIQFRVVGSSVSPLALNLFKSVVSMFLLIPSILFIDPEGIFSLSGQVGIVSFFSGVIGVTLADSLYFSSLNRLGAGLAAIANTLYTPFVIFLSFIFLGERLDLLQFFGVALVLGAVILVSMAPNLTAGINREMIFSGLLFAAGASLSAAAGIVMVKPFLSDESASLILITGVRVLGGTLGLVVVILFTKKRRALLNSLMECPHKGFLFSGAVLGGFFAIVIWLAGMKYTEASVSAVLNQLSTVFIFIFGVLFLREPFSRRRILAVLMAVCGAILTSVSSDFVSLFLDFFNLV